MSVIVNEVARNVSSANGFYRVESYAFNAIDQNNYTLSTARTTAVTFANASNIRGIMVLIAPAISTYYNAELFTRSVTLDLEEAKTVGSFNTTTDRINITAHGLSNGQQVRFTSTGTLPTGMTTANVRYYVVNATTDDFQIASTVGGAAINISGTPTGTATCWIARGTKTRTASEIYGTGQEYVMSGTFATPFIFSSAVTVDTAANKWRITVIQEAGVGTYTIVTTPTTGVFFHVAWSDTAVSYSDTNDMIVSLATLTIDQNFSPKAYSFYSPASSTVQYSLCGLCCTPDKDKRAWLNNSMLTVDSSARTITLDGLYGFATHSGLYLGTEANPRTTANKITVNLKATPTIGASRYSGFADLGLASNYDTGGVTICMVGEVPTKRYATLTADAATGQANLVVDDATGFANGDKVYVSKQDGIMSLDTMDNTQYTIQSIASNTITLTGNVIALKRLTGGYVIKANGYGVEMFCDTLTGGSPYAHGIRVHGATNYFIKGVHLRGILCTTGYSAARKFVDNALNERTGGGWYCGYNLIENYQGTQTAGYVASSSYPTATDFIIENNISVNSIAVGSFNKFVATIKAGTVFKGGREIVRNNISIRHGSYTWGGTGSSNATIIAYGNTTHNANCGHIISQTGGEVYNNYCYGCTYGTYMVTNFNCNSYNNTIERCRDGVFISAASIVNNSKSKNDSYASISTYNLFLAADVLADYLFDNCVGNFTNFDNTFQANMVAGTKIRVQTNNQATNNDFTIYPEGVVTRTGDSLGDTTVHTTGTNKFAMRLDPTDPTLTVIWEQAVPIGNIQDRDMVVTVWSKINNAAYWAGTNELPKLNIIYDNGTTVYSQAAQLTDWQKLECPFTPLTTYGQITIQLTAKTDALTTNKYVYFDDFSVSYPDGYALNLSGVDNWANGLPVTPTISQVVADASTILDAILSNHTIAGTVGKKLNNLHNPSMLLDGEVII